MFMTEDLDSFQFRSSFTLAVRSRFHHMLKINPFSGWSWPKSLENTRVSGVKKKLFSAQVEHPIGLQVVLFPVV